MGILAPHQVSCPQITQGPSSYVVSYSAFAISSSVVTQIAPLFVHVHVYLTGRPYHADMHLGHHFVDFGVGSSHLCHHVA